MRDYYQEPSATVYQGHALDILRELSPESADCVITSPPYWGLRTYKTEPIIWGDNNCEHEWQTEQFKQHAGRGDCQSSKKYSEQEPIPDMTLKRDFCLKCGAWKGELGLEPTIELYISHLLQIFDEVKRVLKKTGTLWVNIGDSYSGSGGDHKPEGKNDSSFQTDIIHGTQARYLKNTPPKSLCLIPERFALGMVERGWILRNNIIWYKPNPMPESVKDRFTGTYEYVYFFTKAQRYWFEQQFEPIIYQERWGEHNKIYNETERKGLDSPSINPLDRNKRDVWEINTQPYPEAHFAVFPEKLVETPILAGCPSQICKKCGKAREKILDTESHYTKREKAHAPNSEPSKVDSTGWSPPTTSFKGYTGCGCNAGFEPGVVMDIFAGSGTTGLVVKKLGRKYIGIELSPKYCKMHVKRLQSIPMAMELA